MKHPDADSDDDDAEFDTILQETADKARRVKQQAEKREL
jgi:hypothetical protein